MKMIEVFNMMAKDEIKNGTEIVFYYDFEAYVYKYHELYQTFLNNDFERMEEEFVFGGDFLNYEVDVIPPEEEKYWIKFNMRWLRNDIGDFRYLNYVKNYEYVMLADKKQTLSHKTEFTKQELESIQPVREFLEDMQGKYELIEVK